LGSGSNPFQHLEKSAVLQEARIFNETPINPRRCLHILTKIIYLLNQGEHFGTTEATEAFFAMTRLFQSNDQTLRRMCYLTIKEMANISEDVIIHMVKMSYDVVKRWVNEAQEAASSDNMMVQYHALGLLYHLRKNDRLAVSKMLNKFTKSGMKSPFAYCMLIRIASRLLEETDGGHDNPLFDFIESCLRNKHEMVVYEAASAIVHLPNCTARELAPAVSVLQLFCSSPKAALRYAAVRTLNKVVVVQAISALCQKYPRKHSVMMNFLSSMLRDDGGFEYKRAIVDCIISIIEENPESKETGLAHLCEFIEDCEHTVLATKILHMLGKEGPKTPTPSKYIRFIFNRVVLESEAVRAGLSVSVPGLEKSLHQYTLEPTEKPFDMKTVPLASAPINEQKTEIATVVTSKMPEKVGPSRQDIYQEQLATIPEFKALGPLFKSSDPVQLTEAETEYVVRCIKHTFTNHMVFQFDCTNTLNDQLLQKVMVQMEPSEAYEVVHYVPALDLPYSQPGSCYTLVRLPDDDPTAVSCTFSCTMKYLVRDCDPNTGEPDEDGYDDEYVLEDLEVTVADHIQRVLKPNFGAAWEEVGDEFEKEETFALASVKTLEEAVGNIISFLGMQPCERSDKVPENKNSHVLFLADYRYKKDELFKRLKVTTFAQLVIQVASVSDQNDGENNEELCRLDDNNSVLSGTGAELLSERTNGKGDPEGILQTTPVQFINSNDSGETELSPRSTLQSVISGVGEMDLDKASQKNVNGTPASSPRITNKPYTDCPYLLLDVRDRDEYEQCRIIGGLKVIAQKFPEGLTTGSFPPSCPQSVPPTSGRKRSTPRPPSYPAENKWQFTSEDLNKIQFYLEDMLIPTNTNSRLSRLSVGSAQSKASSARSSYTPSAACSDSARTQSSTRHWK
ncbi:UNVERIFIED_CONTAM: hypothetical protein FKN15_023708, partial [Acipenser sinensis]